MRVRRHGESGPTVVLVHGGPGAPGTLAPVGRALADRHRVLEPFQRRSGGAPLTVASHVADLRELVARECPGEPPHLVGHSWGAMLALAFAAACPDRVASLALVGCGTFDPRSRAALEAELERRTTPSLRARLARLEREVADPDERLAALGRAVLPLYAHDLSGEEPELERCDARGHRESWDDMLRLQADGTYPAAFSAVTAPARMLHGDRDPHPGRAIWAGLRAHVPHLELEVLERCGHDPWLERAAREPFLAALQAWLERAADGARGGS